MSLDLISSDGSLPLSNSGLASLSSSSNLIIPNLLRFDEIVGRITIFSTTACKHCKAAKNLLNIKGVPYIEINLDDFPGRRTEASIRSNGGKTVPQIFFNEQHIGGNSNLQAIEAKGELDELIIKTLKTKVPDNAPLPPSEADLAEIDAKRIRDGYSAEIHGVPVLRGVIPNSPDEANLLKLLRALRQPELNGGLAIKHYWYNLQRVHTSFIGKDLVDWLIKNKFSGNREQAILLGQRLFRLNLIHHVSNEHEFKDEYLFYRFFQDEDRFILNNIIGPTTSLSEPQVNSQNDIKSNSKESDLLAPKENAKEVSAYLRKQISAIYNKYLLPDGSALDYDGVSNSDEFSIYALSTSRLNAVDISELSLAEKKVVFINLYNALIIHGNIVIGNPTSVAERGTFFTSTSYMIGGLKYSLNDIEHGILRGNKPPPFSLFQPFGRNDPRRFHSLPLPSDPRIHFALNCGAKSCPSVKLFSVENLEEELNIASEAFCEDKDSFDIDESTTTLYLSKIFYWYEIDFGADIYERLTTISKYLSQPKQIIIKNWIENKIKINIVYRDYDWGQNTTKNNTNSL